MKSTKSTVALFISSGNSFTDASNFDSYSASKATKAINFPSLQSKENITIQPDNVVAFINKGETKHYATC